MRSIVYGIVLWLLVACTPTIRPAPVPLVAPEQNPVVLQVQQMLAQQIQADPTTLAIVSATEEIWPDACLGAAGADELCIQAQTPGYALTLAVNGTEYRYRTNLDGSAMRLVAAPDAVIGERILTWIGGDDSGCQTLEAGADGVAFGRCGGVLMGVPYRLETRQPELTWFAGQYQSFAAETSAGTVDFVGYGSMVATPVEQRRIAEWARLVYLEAQGGRTGASWGLVFAWHREGGIAGFCDDVTVYITGDAYITSCKGNQPQALGRIQLVADQLATVYQWVDTLQPFESAVTDPAVADAMTTRLLFSGTGAQVATEEEQQAMAAFAQGLLEQTMPAATTDAVPAELTYSSGPGGFSLRYPATVKAMSEVRPTVDGVLTPAANTVAFVSEAPSYVLSITWFDLADRTVLRSFVDADTACPTSTDAAGQPIDLGGYAALRFIDTPCGPFGATYFFTVVDLLGYRITVDSQAFYAEIQPAVESILATLQFQPPALGAALPTFASD